MKFPSPLIHGVLERRYKRFLADVRLDSGEVVTAHCANSGSMMGVKEPGSEVWLSPATNPARKLRYSWELIRVGDGLVGINTSHPNLLVSEAVTAGLIAPLNGYATLRREVKYGQNSRIDLLLEDHPCAPNCYVEVKNVTLMRQPGLAEFPDAVTTRGTKHLTELTEMVNQGYRAVMFYLVQREDCHSFALAHDIDSAYSAAFTQARAKGVEILCYRCNITLGGISVGTALAI